MIRVFRRLSVLSVISVSLVIGLLCSFILSHSFRCSTIVIGGKGTTEQLIIAEMIAQLIKKKTDLRVKRRTQLDGTLICFEALLSGDIDLYFEYSGTAQIFILKEPYIGQSKDSIYAYVKEAFKKRYAIEWLKPLGFDNRYVVATSQSLAEQHQLETISDFKEFQEKKGDATFVCDSEFSCLPELELLRNLYGINTHNMPMMEKTLAYLSLTEGGIDAMIAYKTDGLLSRSHIRVLKDDLRALPPYDVAPIVRCEALQKHPELKPILELLAGKISDETMQQLNDKVERGDMSYKDVAIEFLIRENLIPI